MLSSVSKLAIKSVIFICIKGDEANPLGVEEICEHIKTPKPYTSKILQSLVKKGLLYSKKGKGGGFYLNESQCNNTLLPIVVALEGDGAFQGCGLGLDYCSAKNPCPAHDYFLKVRATYTEFLTAKTIARLAKEVESGQDYIVR